jgi:hypothetical protein
MTFPSWLSSLLAALAVTAVPVGAATAPATAPAPQTAPAGGAGGYHRIDLPGGEGKPFPYTVEVPADWQVREIPNSPGLWLGPADAQPPSDPRLIYVRISLANLEDPEKVAANIRAADAKNDTWSAPRVEVRDLEGVKGVLVRMDSGSADAARSTLALKLPLDKGGVDFLASAPRAEFDTLLPVFERILLSVRRRAS